MAFFITSEYELQKIAPPALPQPGEQYSRAYQDQLNNVFRLYFNRLQSILGQLDSNSGVLPATGTFAVDDLPSAADVGASARSFVSDALTPVFGATVVGGGAVVVPVYSDGTDWKVG
jgi:hypothetical protein